MTQTATGKPHITGWCSPCCSPRAHAICQDRLDKNELPRGCACPKHTPRKDTT